VSSVIGKHIAIFISYSGQGGVEHVINLLTREFVRQGVRVDLVLSRTAGEHLAAVPENVNVIALKTSHTYTATFHLARYLKAHHPDALLAVKHRGIITAILARFISGYKGILAGNIHTNVTASLKHSSFLKRVSYIWGMRLFYRWADRIIAVSQGVADDIMKITGFSPDKVRTVYNPVVTAELFSKAGERVDHPWFGDTGVPVIVGMGRLTKQKDFHTLIKAFAKMREECPCRLVILGEGGDRSSLESLTENLGISKDVDLPGFHKNPFPFLSRADLFVLSSRWEGFGLVLVEALALGVPVVSTDCPSGPREILEDGRYGPLVPIEDPAALAKAIKANLVDPLDPEMLKSAAREFTANKISEKYIRSLLD
jgi:glycosyltransferase involved in cell wall biosynthesis